MMTLTNCNSYVEDPNIYFSCGEPKGQCLNCGDKWYNHKLETLSENEREGARRIQAEKWAIYLNNS